MTADAVEIETGPEPTGTVIWLHGLGADGHDFEPLVPELELRRDVNTVRIEVEAAGRPPNQRSNLPRARSGTNAGDGVASPGTRSCVR